MNEHIDQGTQFPSSAVLRLPSLVVLSHEYTNETKSIIANRDSGPVDEIQRLGSRLNDTGLNEADTERRSFS